MGRKQLHTTLTNHTLTNHILTNKLAGLTCTPSQRPPRRRARGRHAKCNAKAVRLGVALQDGPTQQQSTGICDLQLQKRT